MMFVVEDRCVVEKEWGSTQERRSYDGDTTQDGRPTTQARNEYQYDSVSSQDPRNLPTHSFSQRGGIQPVRSSKPVQLCERGTSKLIRTLWHT